MTDNAKYEEHQVEVTSESSRHIDLVDMWPSAAVMMDYWSLEADWQEPTHVSFQQGIWWQTLTLTLTARRELSSDISCGWIKLSV